MFALPVAASGWGPLTLQYGAGEGEQATRLAILNLALHVPK